MDLTLYSHLGPSAQSAMGLSQSERIFYIKQDHWVGYTRAKEILQRMEEILQAPMVIRPECLLIIGDTNNGKSRILHRFMERHAPVERPDGAGTQCPAVMIQAPPGADPRRLYEGILDCLGGFGLNVLSRGLPWRLTITQLRNLGVRMLIIDEIHDLVAGSHQRQKDALAALKNLANELRIPVVGAGIESAHFALANIDPQLENRFKPLVLTRWKDGVELRRFIKSMVGVLPLMKESLIDHPGTAKYLATLMDGKIGELITILKCAAVVAIESEVEQIDLDIIRKVESIAPAHRRGLIHGNL